MLKRRVEPFVNTPRAYFDRTSGKQKLSINHKVIYCTFCGEQAQFNIITSKKGHELIHKACAFHAKQRTSR